MADSIKIFENSLRDYLINSQSDSYNTAMRIQYRYNNLKVFMDPKKSRTPHFFVSVGISEACYAIETLDLLNGSLGADNRYVVMWGNRPNINGELKKHWTYITQSNEILNAQANADEEDVKTDQKKPIIEDDIFMPNHNIVQKPSAEVSDVVTGTGLKSKQNGPNKGNSQSNQKNSNNNKKK